MLCRDPYMAGAIPLGCGKCLPCRINRRRQWMWRQYLESLCHDHSSFVTLTYADSFLPQDGALEPVALQLFLKRLRRALHPRRIRFFAVGEYGGRTRRPHYHLSLFGLSGFDPGDVLAVAKSWPSGFTQVAEFNHHTAQYVAGYTVKKLKDKDDGIIWKVPEFARMSNRPGIGALAMETIGKQLLDNYQGWPSGDVPSELSIGKRKIPLSRYLISMLRKNVGFTPQYIEQVKGRYSYEKSIEMQSLLVGVEDGSTIKAQFLKDIEGRLIQIEERNKLLKKGTL